MQAAPLHRVAAFCITVLDPNNVPVDLAVLVIPLVFACKAQAPLLSRSS
jgi:hypothetical protein